MGEPMCGHLARRGGKPVLAYDQRPEPRRRLAAAALTAADPGAIARELRPDPAVAAGRQAVERAAAARTASAPGPVRRRHVHLARGDDAGDRRATGRQGHGLRRRAGRPHAGGGGARRAVSIMVGASEPVFAHIAPLLHTMGTDVTHCGPVGCGQVVKILNNMLVFQNVAALAEAIAHRPAQRCGAGHAAVDHGQGLGRQLRAAQPRHEDDGAAASFRCAPSPPAMR